MNTLIDLRTACFAFLMLLTGGFLQAQNLEKIKRLDGQLKEISGLTFLNDSVLVAHNDSGHEACLYFLNLKGELIYQVEVENAQNIDWEDITTDHKGNLYISDLGNNQNKREDLKIYIVKTENILQKTKMKADVISISYNEQSEFPPNRSARHFDSEALAYHNDSLVIFTKSQTQPYDGLTRCYKIPAKKGSYEASAIQEIQLKARSFRMDAVTAAEIIDSTCYLLTYSGIEVFDIEKGFLKYRERISFLILSQKEALTVNRSYFYIADEYNKKLGGNNLFQLSRK